MVGLILLAVTWLLLRMPGERLTAIGLDQGFRRLAEFVAGFALMGLATADQQQQLGLSAATGDPFVPDVGSNPAARLDAARFVGNSVLFEELLFRGYLLYQAVRWLGPGRAVWLDAAAFGICHWLRYGGSWGIQSSWPTSSS